MRERLKDLSARMMQNIKLRDTAGRLTTMANFVAWCDAHPCTTVTDRHEMHTLAMERAGPDQPITYLEFGVYKGESFRWWAEQCRHPDSRFVGFDTFSGLPEDWTPAMKKGHFDTGGQIPDIDDSRATFEPGLFQDTLPHFVKQFDRTNRICVHLDADLYSATLFVLIWLLPMMQPGDLLIFDEFHDYMDEYQALEHALRAFHVDLDAVVSMKGYADRGYARVAAEIKTS